MKHDIDKRFAPGEEQKSGPGAIIGTCWACGKSGVGRNEDCDGPPSTTRIAGNWSATPGVGEDILADIAAMAKVIEQNASKSLSRPWCCGKAFPKPRIVRVENNPQPLFFAKSISPRSWPRARRTRRPPPCPPTRPSPK